MEISGGNPQRRFMLEMTMRKGQRSLCLECGGYVLAVEDGEELPEELQLARGPMLKAMLVSALSWIVMFYMASMTFLSPPENGAVKLQAWSAETLFLKVSLFGALAGCLVTIFAALFAAQRPDLNGPYQRGLMPFGQAATMLPVVAVSGLLGFVIAYWVAPWLAPPEFVPNTVLIRGFFGVMIGVLAGANTHRFLFKYCREYAAAR
jgi:MFS family permease